MRRDSMVAWRSGAKLAIVVGLLGGLGLGGYSVFWLAVNGLASPGCGGGGCEDRLNAEADHYQSLLYIALFVGGGLVIAGITAVVMLGRRLKQVPPPTLPVATIVESGRDHS